MRLLLSLDFPPEKGGIQNYLFEITNFLYQDNDFIITCGKNNKDDKQLKPTVIRVISFPFKKLSLILMIPAFMKILLFKRNIKVEAGNIYAALLPWIFSFFLKIKYSVYTYGTELTPLKKTSIKTKILRSVLNRAETIYSLLESQSQILYPITKNRNIKVLPPKIDLHTQWEKRENKSSSPLKLLSVGRLVEHKGHSILIRAVSKLNIDYQLTIIGSGDNYNNLITLINDLKLHNKIFIKQNLPKEELSEFYKESDIFVFPSLDLPTGREGFGIVLLEAMSYSLPIIASDSGGISEVLGYGDFGILVPPGNCDELSKAITNLHNDIDLQNKLTEKAFNVLVKNYVW